MEIRFRVNRKLRRVCVHPLTRLLDILRLELGLTGTKEGCGEGECGACAVLMDGELVNSCLIPAVQLHGRSIETIEGLSKRGRLHPIQQSFIQRGGTQCGFCTSGMIMASVALLMGKKHPSSAQIGEHLAGNLCRCTGYSPIVDSVRKVGKK
ncbi:MAG: (2Fe-2S)-binding protein [Deltaproteobacteria bacterium]|nr:(2Fe-2S)-binding protein [Deltaproteobacteria bacterium]